jgi:hypothetical protein
MTPSQAIKLYILELMKENRPNEYQALIDRQAALCEQIGNELKHYNRNVNTQSAPAVQIAKQKVNAALAAVERTGKVQSS